eukprot:2403357-Amphidinium_carterae.1
MFGNHHCKNFVQDCSLLRVADDLPREPKDLLTHPKRDGPRKQLSQPSGSVSSQRACKGLPAPKVPDQHTERGPK